MKLFDIETPEHPYPLDIKILWVGLSMLWEELIGLWF